VRLTRTRTRLKWTMLYPATHALVSFGQGTDTEIHDVSEGDMTFIPTGYFHWIENTSKQPVQFLLVLNHEEAETIEFQDVLKVLNGRTDQR